MKQSNTSSPVLLQSAADGGTNEVRVLLQLIQSLLNGLVDGLLDGLTHPIDLVHAPARLNETKRVSFWEQLCKRQCILKRDGLETSTTNPEGVFLTDSRKRCCTCSAKNKLEVRREGCTNLPCGVEFCGCRSQDGAAITQDRGSRCQRWLIKCDGLQPLLPPKQWITLSAIILQNKSSCSSHQDPTGNLKWGIYIQGQSMTAQPQG